MVTNIGNKYMEIVKREDCGIYEIMFGPNSDPHLRYVFSVEEKGLLEIMGLFDEAKRIFGLQPKVQVTDKKIIDDWVKRPSVMWNGTPNPGGNYDASN